MHRYIVCVSEDLFDRGAKVDLNDLTPKDLCKLNLHDNLRTDELRTGGIPNSCNAGTVILCPWDWSGSIIDWALERVAWSSTSLPRLMVVVHSLEHCHGRCEKHPDSVDRSILHRVCRRDFLGRLWRNGQ